METVTPGQLPLKVETENASRAIHAAKPLAIVSMEDKTH